MIILSFRKKSVLCKCKAISDVVRHLWVENANMESRLSYVPKADLVIKHRKRQNMTKKELEDYLWGAAIILRRMINAAVAFI